MSKILLYPNGVPQVRRNRVNQEWFLDFVSDVDGAGRVTRALIIADAVTHECLMRKVDTQFSNLKITNVLDELIAQQGLPSVIRCNHWSELRSEHFQAWAFFWEIVIYYMPGRLRRLRTIAESCEKLT